MSRSACGAPALAAALVVVGAALASDPIGGYLIVDKVVLTPTKDPTTIQVWGSIALAKEKGGGGHAYAAPVRGYLYYKAPSGKEVVCRKEWNDLKKVAGTGQVIGFGSSYDRAALGRIRKANEKPESPDAYPLADGLVKVDVNSGRDPIRNLLALPTPTTPAEGDLVPPGEVTLIVRNILDKTHSKPKYVFELVGPPNGKATASETATVEAGVKETKWTPKLKVKPGEKYTWSVRATDGKWKGPEATSSFIVKGEKSNK